MFRFVFLLPVLLLFAPSAFGWGCEGHQMIALIARAHLTLAVSSAVDHLLKDNPIDPALNRFCQGRPADPMADSATWADDVKEPEKTQVWHYIDITLALHQPAGIGPYCPPIGPSVDGKDRPGCVTDAMEYEWLILRDQVRSSSERATALRYMIHLVGDVHQPLHAENNDDQGGNCTVLQFFGEARPINLHAIWDYKLIQHQLKLKKMTLPEYAAELDERFAVKWPGWSRAKIDFIAWAWESHDLAEPVAYGKLKPPIPVQPLHTTATCDGQREKATALKLSVREAYFREAMPVIDERLSKAAYRLGALLNQSF